MIRQLIKYILFSQLVFVVISCKDKQVESEGLVLLKSVVVDLPECSGLDFYKDKLVTVSDTTNRVYFIDFNGNVLDSLPFEGDDLEGVCYNDSNSEFWVVDEKSSDLIHLDNSGHEIKRINLQVESQNGDHGLEGVSIRESDQELYLLVEKLPGQLIIIDSSGSEKARIALNFAEDYSAIFYDEYDHKLWILSEDSRILFKCDTLGQREKSWALDIKSAEGLAVNSSEKKIYIVTDSKPGKLNIFSY